MLWLCRGFPPKPSLLVVFAVLVPGASALRGLIPSPPVGSRGFISGDSKMISFYFFCPPKCSSLRRKSKVCALFSPGLKAEVRRGLLAALEPAFPPFRAPWRNSPTWDNSSIFSGAENFFFFLSSLFFFSSLLDKSYFVSLGIFSGPTL